MIIFDALHGKLLIAKEKFDKTMKLLHDVMHQAEISPRGMAKLRGKFGHQFRCIEGVGPFLVPFNKFIGGPESVYEWDEPKTVPQALQTTMGQLYEWLPRLQPEGADMWPLDPATLLFRWERGLPHGKRPLVVVYWDSSPLSAGLSIRTRPDQIWRTAGMHYDRGQPRSSGSGSEALIPARSWNRNDSSRDRRCFSRRSKASHRAQLHSNRQRQNTRLLASARMGGYYRPLCRRLQQIRGSLRLLDRRAQQRRDRRILFGLLEPVGLCLRSGTPRYSVHIPAKGPGESSLPPGTIRRCQSNLLSPHRCHGRLLERPKGAIDGAAGANLSAARIAQSAGHHGESYGFLGRLRRH
jgi:hypothetical protein